MLGRQLYVGIAALIHLSSEVLQLQVVQRDSTPAVLDP